MAYDVTNYDVIAADIAFVMSYTSSYDVTYQLVRYIIFDVTVLPLMS